MTDYSDEQIELMVARLGTDEYNQGVPRCAPWRTSLSCSGPDRWIVYQPTGSDQSRIITEGARQPFADFIAAARELVPSLLARAQQAEAAVAERLRQFNAAKDQRDAALAEADRLRAELAEAQHTADHNADAVNENADMIVRLRAEVDRYRNGCAQANQQGEEAQAELRGLRAELAEAKADVDDLRRQLLDETYRPEGGEIVMRELIDAKAALHKALSREITLAAQVAAVRALCDEVENRMMATAKPSEIRAALDGTEQDGPKRPAVPPPDPRMAVRACCGDVHFGDDCDPSAAEGGEQ